MTQVEQPEWDASTRAWGLAYESATYCPRCGLPTSICQAPENEGRFNVEPPIRCHALTALLLAQKKYEEGIPAHEALIWTPPTLRR